MYRTSTSTSTSHNVKGFAVVIILKECSIAPAEIIWKVYCWVVINSSYFVSSEYTVVLSVVSEQ